MENGFTWRTDNDAEYGVERIELTYNDINNSSRNLMVKIAHSHGCNMCEFNVGSDNLIKYKGELVSRLGFSGSPILYPSPNRMRDCKFVYKGKTYKQVKNGKEIFLHGLVYNEKWAYELPIIYDDCVIFKTWIDFSQDSPMFEAFPFKHRLSVDFILDRDGIKLNYSVENFDTQEIPFGIGFHPCFFKLCGGDGTFVTIPSDRYMEKNDDLLPTGRYLDVQNTRFDVRRPTAVESVNIDDNYVGIKSENPAVVTYVNKPYNLSFNTSDEFTRIVLYLPDDLDFFCVENQTCSTDAHNMYDRGFKEESGLIILSPGETHKGFVKYTVNFK